MIFNLDTYGKRKQLPRVLGMFELVAWRHAAWGKCLQNVRATPEFLRDLFIVLGEENSKLGHLL